MKVQAVDTTKLEEVIQGLEVGAQLERRRPDRVCDAVCYELLADYFRKAQKAKEEGKYLVCHTTTIPPEVFYAMDIVPLQLESVGTLASQIVQNFGDALSAASAFGLVPEVCSAHRLLAGQTILGWLPRPDAIVWSNQVCDNTAKSGNLLVELSGCPGFFLERPYRYTEGGVQYFAQELEELVHFLEELTGRNMDWDRLAEIMEQSRRLMELHREIRELRKAVPSPWRNLWYIHMMGTELYMAGTPEAITHFETIRDEVKKRAEGGEGYIHEERYRVLTLFVPPAYSWTLLGWMQRKHGAISVAEPYFSYRDGGEIDPTKPLDSLARKSFYCPICRPMYGPAEEGILHDTVRDALEYKAEGTVYFAHIGCRQTDACIRIIKDALLEEAGIPTLILDMDLYDPTYAPDDQLKDKLEGFFELLDERK